MDVILDSYGDTGPSGSPFTSIGWENHVLSSDCVMIVRVRHQNIVTSVDFNGVALTLFSLGYVTGGWRSEYWYLKNPPVGPYFVTVNFVSGTVGATGDSVVYANSDLTLFPDASVITSVDQNPSSSPYDIPITTTKDGARLVLFLTSDTSTFTAGTGTDNPTSGLNEYFFESDTVRSPAGAQNLTVEYTGTPTIQWAIFSLVPVSTPPPTSSSDLLFRMT